MLNKLRIAWMQHRANHHRASADMYGQQAGQNLKDSERHTQKAIRIEIKIRALRAAL